MRRSHRARAGAGRWRACLSSSPNLRSGRGEARGRSRDRDDVAVLLQPSFRDREPARHARASCGVWLDGGQRAQVAPACPGAIIHSSGSPGMTTFQKDEQARVLGPTSSSAGHGEPAEEGCRRAAPCHALSRQARWDVSCSWAPASRGRGSARGTCSRRRSGRPSRPPSARCRRRSPARAGAASGTAGGPTTVDAPSFAGRRAGPLELGPGVGGPHPLGDEQARSVHGEDRDAGGSRRVCAARRCPGSPGRSTP